MFMITVKIAETKEEIEQAFMIREEVFIKGQNIPREIEMDGLDKDAIQIILYYSNSKEKNKPVGCGRIRIIGKNAKLERAAVLESFRAQGFGKEIIKYMVKYAKEKGYKEIYLNAQYHLLDYYKKLGFKEVGEPFEEAGIKHIKLVLVQ